MRKIAHAERTAASHIRSSIGPINIKPIPAKMVNPKNLKLYQEKLGFAFDEDHLRTMMHAMFKGFGQDSLQPLITTASMPTLVQFLQAWLPGFVAIETAARRCDDAFGIDFIGMWEDVEVVQGIMEMTGTPQYYQDYSNVPLSSWNVNFNYRNTVQFEEGMRVGVREAKTSARIRVDTAAQKRLAAARALEIVRNQIAWFGFNSGNNLTYGLFNDPGKPAYQTLPNGVSGMPYWLDKTYLEITKDIQFMMATIQNNSQDLVNPQDTATTFLISTDAYQALNTSTDFGYSVFKYIKDTYPKMRIVSAPELNANNGGVGTGFLWADRIDDASTDGGKTIIQMVQTKFETLGVEQLSKAYIEDYTNSTAGVMIKRPFLLMCVTGISTPPM